LRHLVQGVGSINTGDMGVCPVSRTGE
jgi:hypothetical protein